MDARVCEIIANETYLYSGKMQIIISAFFSQNYIYLFVINNFICHITNKMKLCDKFKIVSIYMDSVMWFI